MKSTPATEAWIRGQDYHMHSNWSDGEGGLDAVVRHCHEHGIRRCAITDHVEFGHHSDVSARWTEYRLAVDRVQDQAAALGIELLVGIESGVDTSGHLLAPPEVMSDVDFVIASLHVVRGVPGGPQSVPEAEYWSVAKKQIEAAIRCEHVDIIGHIEGYLPADFSRYHATNFAERRRAEREIAQAFFPLEWYAKIGELAKEHGVAIELHGMSATPRVQVVKVLRDAGAKLSIGSDGHRISDICQVDHIVQLAGALNLTVDDFYTPGARLSPDEYGQAVTSS